jgi:hypothetical protein
MDHKTSGTDTMTPFSLFHINTTKIQRNRKIGVWVSLMALEQRPNLDDVGGAQSIFKT